MSRPSRRFCLLTGKPPYEGDDIFEVLRKVQSGEFAPPRQLDRSLDKALEAVCLKAMALKPDNRYPTSQALADDLEPGWPTSRSRPGLSRGRGDCCGG